MLQLPLACDSLENGDGIRPTLAQSEYYTLPRSSVIIDLTSLANQSYTNASISISGNPSKGELTQVDALLFKYKPAADFTNGEDQFDASVKSDGNIVSTQRIKIHAKASKKQFPCALITLEDKVETKPGSTISIAVLDNDWFCGVDKSSLTLSIHSTPLYGQTVVDGESINYIPGFDYGSRDQFIYKLTSSADESIYYGIVSIVDPSSAIVHPSSDFEEGVYIAGSGPTSDRIAAKVWGRDIASIPTYPQYNSTATSIFLAGGDQYVVGYGDNLLLGGEWQPDVCVSPPCPIYAMLWKNGAGQPLTADLDSHAFSLFVSIDDVYVVGDIFSSNGRSVATQWINGVAQTLSDGKFFGSSATSVFVSNDDVYVAGYEENYEGRKAKLWKNGVPETLAGGSNATSVFVVGSDVYVAGYGSSGAVVWRNGVPQTLSSHSDSFALSVYVAGEDVFVAGYENTSGATVWKNGEPTALAGGSIANSISVSDGDVYVVGQIGDMATIWKNGISKSLGQGNATALFIRK